MPSAAPTVSAFMRIALTGSTTEPVMSHSTAQRQRDEQPDGERQVRADRVLLVDELRRGAADEQRVGRRALADLADERRAASPSGSPAAAHVHLPGRVVERARLADRCARRAAPRAPPRTPRRRPARLRASTTIVIGLVSWPPKSRARVSATVRALWPFGITDESTGVQTARSAGRARSEHQRAGARAATGSGRRMTAWASRYQRPAPPGARAGAGRRASRPRSRTSRARSRARRAPATSATTAPAIPIDCRKPSGKTVSVIRAKATVTALKATVRPAVAIVVRTAPAPGPWRSSSSRKRVTRNSV